MNLQETVSVPPILVMKKLSGKTDVRTTIIGNGTHVIRANTNSSKHFFNPDSDVFTSMSISEGLSSKYNTAYVPLTRYKVVR